jgi:hypothetical protein|nr:MAG TPA: structural protein [Caudoviricetes sp.]
MKQQFLDLNGLTELVTYLKKSITEQKEILPYASNKLFPSTGNVNTIYIDTATNSIYRWDSSNKKYEILAKAVKSVSISESTENGKITLTVDGNKTTVPIHGLGSAAYTNSSAYSPAGHTHTKAQVGLGNVDNTADANKSVKHATTADSATTAGTATNVSAGEGTADAARHVWFSDSATETKRAYSDKFKYNPVTNNLTVNVTGNAATASSVAWNNVTGKPSTYAPSAHNHDDSTITSLNASKLFGTIDIARLPHGALERCVIVEDDTARFALTTAKIQLGDTVKVNKTQKMYFVIDDSKLSSEAGYSVYTAGTATSVPWSGVTGKPSSYPPASHNHDERYYTETEMNSKLAEKATKVHTHVKSEVGLGNVDNTADANKSVKYATSAGSSTTSGAISSSGTLDTVAKLDAFIEGGKVKYATVSALDGLNGMIKNDGICISTPWSSTGYGHQFYINDNGFEVYHRFRNTTKVNNVDTTTWSSWKQILDSSNYNIYAPTKTGSGASGTWGISVTGNAATATKLATARSINGTNFNGSGNITTATWGTARNLTIGSTKKSVNGGADVSWSLSEIGAAAASHSHSYLPLSGGTLTGNLNLKPASGEGGEIHLDASTANRTENGIILDQQGGNFRIFGVPSADGTTKTGSGTPLVINPYSKTITGGYTLTGALSGNASTATALTSSAGSATQPVYFSGGKPVACSYTINASVPSGAKFTDTNTWRGIQNNLTSDSTSDSLSAAQGKALKALVDGKAPSNHSHSYLPLSGGTMSGTATITWADSGNWGNSNKNVTFPVIRGGLSWIGQSDGIQLYAVETQNDNLELYLKFTDDNSNGLSIRNKENTQTARISANGEITASKFVGNLSGTASAVPWSGITGKPSTFTPASHTHNYAGSSSAGGNANAAVKLATARKIGNASFDGTANITLSQMGLNVPVEITKADYLAKKKAGTLNANTYYNVIDEYDSANVINDSSVTANSAFSSTKSEKTYAKKSAIINTTLTASKWTGSSAPYTYVLPVSGATTSNIVEINYASNASSQAIEAYQNAMLADGGQTTNQITIKATEKPTVDIPITIVIRNDL